MKLRNPRLLIVEDSFEDEKLIRRALQQMNRNFEVEVVHDGAAAIERLCGEESTDPLPDIVLLDWKLPKVMGAEVLEQVRTHPRCKNLVVVAFSSSDRPEDRRECQRLAGNGYVVKPVDYQGFLSAVRGIISEHWDAVVARSPDSSEAGDFAKFYTANTGSSS